MIFSQYFSYRHDTNIYYTYRYFPLLDARIFSVFVHIFSEDVLIQVAVQVFQQFYSSTLSYKAVYIL